MPPKTPRLDVRLHVMVTPTQKQAIEGAATRLRATLGRPVSEAQVVRAAIEQTDFSNLALNAAPAADEKKATAAPTSRTTLTPEQAAIIEGAFASDGVARTIDGAPRAVLGSYPMPPMSDEVKRAFVNWASEDPLVNDVPDELTAWLDDEIAPDPVDVETVTTYAGFPERRPCHDYDIHTPATPRDEIAFAEGLTLPPEEDDRTGIPEGVEILAERPRA